MKAIPTLTDLQFRLMDMMAHCEMTSTNGATPTQASDVNTYLWADERAAELGITKQAVGGVLTSLENAGLAKVQAPTRGDKDGGFQFTELGFEAWQAEHESRAQAATAPKADEITLLTNRELIAAIWQKGKVAMPILAGSDVVHVVIEKTDLVAELQTLDPDAVAAWKFYGELRPGVRKLDVA